MIEPHTLHPVLQQLLGCAWGRTVAMTGDAEPCPKRAERIVVFHAGETQVEARLCAHHLEIALRETTPHVDQPST